MRIVLLAVENIISRAGLHRILSTCHQLTVVENTENPDVVVVEIGHDTNAWERIPARYAPAPVVGIAPASPGLLNRAAHARVTTCLTHGRFTEAQLVATVLELAPRTPGLPPLLRGREAETMDLISRGLSNEEIAHLLGVRVKTVKNRVNNIFSTLNARHRAEAVAIWLGTSVNTLANVA